MSPRGWMPKFDSNYIKNAVAKKNIAEQRFKILTTETKSSFTTTFIKNTGNLNDRRLLSPQEIPHRRSDNEAKQELIINVTKLASTKSVHERQNKA